MAKSQSRRSISLNRDLCVAASKVALRRGITLSQLTSDALRAFGVEAPETHHVPREVAELAAEGMRHAHQKRSARVAIGEIATARLVESYRRIEHPGPIRKALGDAHADVCGEPTWAERVAISALRRSA